MTGTLQLLFGLTRRVDRRTYITAGVLLMALKLGVDAMVLFEATGRLWGVWEYLSLAQLAEEVPMTSVRILTLWALPFAWIGLSMTVRRAIDAGFSPWVGLLFCVPLLNFGVMLALSLAPSQRPRAPAPEALPQSSGLKAIGGAVLVAMVMTAVAVFGLQNLGLVLFAGTPLGMGVITGYTYNRGAARGTGETILLALGSLIVAGCVFLMLAMEGLLCVSMALPLAAPLAIFGAVLGRSVAVGPPTSVSPVVMLLIVMPLVAWVEPALREERTHRVTSSIVIDAPPQAVWSHVVSFEPLPPPRELWFRLGIAYPTHARIDGSGVGATRYCEFSTGAFVEPITLWDEPRKLAFDVTRQPDPLRELSPYPEVHIDHLHGTITSQRGEFSLTPGPAGTTILEGSTWYQLGLFPESYWTLWTDTLISSIHRRVLEHIKASAEGTVPG